MQQAVNTDVFDQMIRAGYHLRFALRKQNAVSEIIGVKAEPLCCAFARVRVCVCVFVRQRERPKLRESVRVFAHALKRQESGP